MNEDVGGPVGVAGNQIVGIRVKRDEAAIGADRGIEAEVVALIAGGVDADPLGRPSLAVMNEDIGLAVGVAGNQVVGIRVKRDEAAIGADRGTVAGEVALIAGGVDADPLGAIPRVGSSVGSDGLTGGPGAVGFRSRVVAGAAEHAGADWHRPAGRNPLGVDDDQRHAGRRYRRQHRNRPRQRYRLAGRERADGKHIATWNNR
jgi:hypothetical protein